MLTDLEVISRIAHRAGPVTASAGLVKQDIGMIRPYLGDQGAGSICCGHACGGHYCHIIKYLMFRNDPPNRVGMGTLGESLLNRVLLT